MERQKLILVAEDQLDNYELIKAYLKNYCKVLHAENGVDVLDFIREKSDSIDAVLLDLKMPKLDGIKTTRKIRELNFKKPILLITAYDHMVDKQEVFRAGVDFYLKKPLAKKTLLNILDTVLKVEIT